MEKSLFPNPFKSKPKDKGSDTLSETKKKALFDNAKKQAKERDTAKEAERKLKLLAENADNIPKEQDRKSTRLNSSHANISYAVFCLKKNKHQAQLLLRTEAT